MHLRQRDIDAGTLRMPNAIDTASKLLSGKGATRIGIDERNRIVESCAGRAHARPEHTALMSATVGACRRRRPRPAERHVTVPRDIEQREIPYGFRQGRRGAFLGG